MKPYYPGEEEKLRQELDRIDHMIAFVKQNQVLTDKIREVFMEVKDPILTIQRSGNTTLSTVELFEVKSLLLQMRQLRKLTIEHEIGDDQSAHCSPECQTAGNGSPAKAEAAGEHNVDSSVTDNGNEVKTVPEEYFLDDTEDLLDELDPRRDRMNTFYIYNEFSEKLVGVSQQKT